MVLIKIKNIYPLTHTIKWMKIQAQFSLREIITKHLSNTGLLLRIHKELLEFQSKNGNNQVKVWATDLNA